MLQKNYILLQKHFVCLSALNEIDRPSAFWEGSWKVIVKY